MDKFTATIQSSLIEVLKKIDSNPFTQTVFILDNKKVVGTITDGDIRRAFIKGFSLSDPIIKFINNNFLFIEEGKNNFDKLKIFRKKRLKAIPLLNKKGELVKIIDFTKIKSMLPIDAVIMAGGKGSRLRPLTYDTPKPLLKVGDKEIISYNFDRLHQFGINNQYITVNYLAEQLENFCKSYNNKINFNIVWEKEFMGTAGSLSLIDDFKNDTVLLMNSDLLTNIDYEDFYKSFLDSNADLMVASISYPVNLPYAIFDSKDRTVLGLREKPSFTYFANAGIYLIKKKILKNIPKNKFFNATDLMETVISSDKKLVHYPIRSYWLDIGKYEDFEKAQKDIAHINWD
tara:strand:+ start:5249 stop:6283 length:1035 start_codon:yes stop_codon:yes gene_type:complete